MKIQILLICFLGVCLENVLVTGLMFDIDDPIKVDDPNGVIEVGKPTKLTCQYMKGRRETVHTVRWYLSYQNKDYGNVFTYHANTGRKDNSGAGLSHLKMTTHTANETNLDIELNDFLGSPITIKCEVEILKDNGYGRLSTDTETKEKPFVVVDTHNVHDDVHKLMELIDPRKHMHVGVPYDFYSGYVLMVANNVDTGTGTVVNSGSGYGSRRPATTPMTHLYGQLPTALIRALQTTYSRRFQHVSNKKYKLEINPVDVLNILGNHGFRVSGFTTEANQNMVWTLEQRDFENELMNSEHHN